MFTIRSLRMKMLVPALVAVIATLLATAVTLWQSGQAAAALESARRRNLKSLLFHKDMYARLGELNALTKWVGETNNYNLNIDFPQNAHDDMVDRFEKEGADVLGAEQSKKTLEALEKYWALASGDAARRITNRLRFNEERAKRANWAWGLNVDLFEEGMDVLYFPCCYLSYDARLKKVAKSTVNILNKAGVKFGILGDRENCCGETTAVAAMVSARSAAVVRGLRDGGGLWFRSRTLKWTPLFGQKTSDPSLQPPGALQPLGSPPPAFFFAPQTLHGS